MKTFNFSFNNMGGIKQIIAFPDKSSFFLNHDPVNNIRSIVINDNPDIISIIASRKEYSFSEKNKTADSGDTYETTISCQIPGDNKENDTLINLLRSRRYWSILSADMNGNLRLTGNYDIIPEFSFERSSGNNPESLNYHSLKFACTDEFPSLFIDKILP